jgi:hypothetical protein
MSEKDSYKSGLHNMKEKLETCCVSMRGDRYGQFPFERFEVFTTVTMQNAVF